ncbi:hypothetical protein D3C77_201750 [compost metagenome]|uniref:hypothetical protein n=1 Tax=Pseudomonas sp. JUb96 TaxID=2940539 RepID=UPI000FB7059C|nr:hypothetical protein [Pseudomonas sp. JUb96]MCW2270885.1 hypothetical protein [Pseudomonas sp. JUb96]
MIGKLLAAWPFVFAPFTYATAITFELDPDAQYSIVNVDGSASSPLVTAQRVGANVTSYTVHQFDCAHQRVRFMGEGTSLTNLSPPDEEDTPIFKGSLSRLIADAVCKPS